LSRIPTPRQELYRWHGEALQGFASDPVDGEPQCGWFRRRLVKGGPWVPARIWMFQWLCQETGELVADELLQCEVAGSKADPEQEWSWLCSWPITRQQYEYMKADANWAEDNAPHEPKANPRQRVDWSAVPVPTF
jgi:hypothetical protein